MACEYIAVIGEYVESDFPYTVPISMHVVTQRGQEIVEWMETDEPQGRYISMRLPPGSDRSAFGVSFSDLHTATAFKLRFA